MRKTMRLTEREEQVLRLIPEGADGTTTARELASLVYEDAFEEYDRPEVAIGDVVRRLVRKGETSPNGLHGFRIHRTRRAGRNPIEIWKRKI